MNIFLRALELEDYLIINKWRSDDEIQSLLGGNKYYVSSERDKKWVENKIFNDKENIVLIICLKERDEVIGYLSIIDIDLRNRVAQWGGIIIGDKANWKKGYASEAANLMLDYVFNELGIHRFYGYWLDENKPSIKMAEKIGFKKEGLLREAVFKGGRFRNMYLMSILENEFGKR